jgi:hypothetical protein
VVALSVEEASLRELACGGISIGQNSKILDWGRMLLIIMPRTARLTRS